MEVVNPYSSAASGEARRFLRTAFRSLSMLDTILLYDVAAGHLSHFGFADKQAYRRSIADHIRLCLRSLVARMAILRQAARSSPTVNDSIFGFAWAYLANLADAPHWESYCASLEQSRARLAEAEADCAADALMLAILLRLHESLSAALTGAAVEADDAPWRWARYAQTVASWNANLLADRLSTRHASLPMASAACYQAADGPTRRAYRLKVEQSGSRPRSQGLSGRHPLLAHVAGHAALALLGVALLFALGTPTGPSVAIGIPIALSAFIVLFEYLDLSWRRLGAYVIAPRPQPRLGIDAALAQPHRVVVAIPIVLRSRGQLSETVARARECCHGLPRSHFSIAILSDFPDSNVEISSGESDLLAEIANAWPELSSGVGDSDPELSFFHRARTYVARERRWMGAGRKFGKVYAFLDYLSGAKADFAALLGTPVSHGARFLAVLDDHTLFSADDILILWRQALHPAHHAECSSTGRVTRGYGLFSASTNTAPQGFKSSDGRFGSASIRPFVHDPNSDLLGERFFAGKGLYDVEVAAKLPVRRALYEFGLSHDVIEAAYLRTSHCADVIFREAAPVGIVQQLVRLERWTRGDILNFAVLAGLAGPRIRDGSPFGKALIVAAFRKQAVHALHFALILAMMLYGAGPVPLLAVAFLPLGVEAVLFAAESLRRYHDGIAILDLRPRLSAFVQRKATATWILSLLPYKSLVFAFAGVRVAWGLATGGPLLEWTPTSAIGNANSLPRLHLLMLAAASLTGVAILIAVVVAGTGIVGGTIALLWIMGPVVTIVMVAHSKVRGS